MHVLFEFLPLILFLGTFLYSRDMYMALGVLMVAMPIGFVIKYLKTRKVDKMYMWSTIFLLVFGAATFYFKDLNFLFWKPTAFYWVVGLAFLGSTWIGDRPLVRRFFDMAADLPTDQLTKAEWKTVNLSWVAFFAAMGVINIYVAMNFSQEFWAYFKVFGLMGITFVFMIAQTFWIVSKFQDPEEAESAESD
ncbi:MAG: inner membrane-spanning protein YciB [Woeseiaceae bacterium]|nr:inner membrane-spanning protein YciB [Woeseiaceae bacterium]